MPESPSQSATKQERGPPRAALRSFSTTAGLSGVLRTRSSTSGLTRRTTIGKQRSIRRCAKFSRCGKGGYGGPQRKGLGSEVWEEQLGNEEGERALERERWKAKACSGMPSVGGHLKQPWSREHRERGGPSSWPPALTGRGAGLGSSADRPPMPMPCAPRARAEMAGAFREPAARGWRRAGRRPRGAAGAVVCVVATAIVVTWGVGWALALQLASCRRAGRPPARGRPCYVATSGGGRGLYVVRRYILWVTCACPELRGGVVRPYARTITDSLRSRAQIPWIFGRTSRCRGDQAGCFTRCSRQTQESCVAPDRLSSPPPRFVVFCVPLL